jgi:hypothetical protein
MPHSPWSSASGTPPTADATMGLPIAIASTRRQYHYVERGKRRKRPVGLAGDNRSWPDGEVGGEALQISTGRTGAYQHELNALHPGHGPYQYILSLLGAQTSDRAHHPILARQPPAPSHLRDRISSMYAASTLVDGRIVESWGNWDMMGMLQQLGAIPTRPAPPSGVEEGA